jgi:hypothetical protein
VVEYLWVFRHVGFFLAWPRRRNVEIRAAETRARVLERMFRQMYCGPFLFTQGMKENTMRRLKNVFCNVERTLTIRTTLRRVACLVAVGGVFGLTSALAKDPAEPESRPINKLKPANATAPAEAGAMPEFLERLKLSQTQQTQASEIIRKYDATLDAVWKQFGEKYMETVRTEVSVLAAIEDNLTEAQRAKVRDQRRQVAHAEKALEGTGSKPNQATAKPADPVEQAVAGDDISLTPEQEAAADNIQQKYVSHLRSLNRDIQGIHNRLVSLEADKLVELEKLLTQQQLSQLRKTRQMMTVAPKITAANKASTTTD